MFTIITGFHLRNVRNVRMVKQKRRGAPAASPQELLLLTVSDIIKVRYNTPQCAQIWACDKLRYLSPEACTNVKLFIDLDYSSISLLFIIWTPTRTHPQELICAHKTKRDVNLNKLKTRMASKHGCPMQPRLVDIISAVPLEYKKILVPKLRAKPVRLGWSRQQRLCIDLSGTIS